MTKYMNAWISGWGSVAALLLLTAASPLSNPADFSSIAQDVCVDDAAGGCLQNEAASVTNPTFVPNKTDLDTGIGGDGANSLSFIVGGIEAIRIDPSPDVKIGNPATEADGLLHVETGNAGSVTANIAADDLIVEHSGAVGISLLSPNTVSASILFGRPQDNDAGRIVYNHNSPDLSFWVEGAEVLTIDGTGDVGIGTITPDELVHMAGAVDGRFTGLLIENTQADAAASLNETAEILFGFAGKNNVARITADKLSDYTSAAEEDSRIGFWVDADGTLTEVAHFMPDGLMLMLTDSKIRFAATSGGSGSIQYKATSGSNRAAFLLAGNNVVALVSRGADGTVEIRANTSTGGNSGEVTVATFEDDGINLLVSGGNLGIGTNTPEAPLHTQLGSAGVDPTWTSAVDVAIFESASTDNAAVQIFTANDKAGHLAFSDPEARNVGMVRYDHLSNAMAFFTDALERLTISSAGVVKIANLGGGDGSSHVCVDASGNLFNQEAAC